eukprot:1291643-Rhodomonas_salina.3
MRGMLVLVAYPRVHRGPSCRDQSLYPSQVLGRQIGGATAWCVGPSQAGTDVWVCPSQAGMGTCELEWAEGFTWDKARYAPTVCSYKPATPCAVLTSCARTDTAYARYPPTR